MMKISGIYKITNTVTGDFYIGSSKNVKRRWIEHKCPSSWKRFPNNQLYKDMQEYGVDKFEFQVIEEVEEGSLKEREQYFIETLKPTYNNYNANGLDVERRKETQKKYNKSDKGKETQKKYNKSDKGKEAQKKYQKSDKGKKSRKKTVNKYYSQLCSYNGETLTLRALYKRFKRKGIINPIQEAKKYLIKNNNPIEFYDVYP